jgi:uridine kinase
MSRTAVLDQLARLILAVDRPHPVRVAVDGVSAAGKTTLANELSGVLGRSGRPTIRAEIDHFKRSLAARTRYPHDSAEDYYFEMYDYPAIRAHLLEPLGPGGSRRYRTALLDYAASSPLDSPEETAPDDAILVADGGFLLRPELDGMWDYRIFVHIDFDLVLARGAARDRAWMPSLEAARERYRKRYIPGEKLYLRRVRPHERAGAVVDNTDFAAPRLTVRPSMGSAEGDGA